MCVCVCVCVCVGGGGVGEGVNLFPRAGRKGREKEKPLIRGREGVGNESPEV